MIDLLRILRNFSDYASNAREKAMCEAADLIEQQAACIAELEARAGEAVAWLREDGEEAITAAKKCSLETVNGLPGKKAAAAYSIALFIHPPIGDSTGKGDELKAEVDRLTAIINAPESNGFVQAILREAEHARVRWQHTDASKTPDDWRGVLAILSQKALDAYGAGDEVKERHHIITTAAACYNWFRDRFGDAAIASLTDKADGEKK
jgi:hypothetical protein